MNGSEGGEERPCADGGVVNASCAFEFADGQGHRSGVDAGAGDAGTPLDGDGYDAEMGRAF